MVRERVPGGPIPYSIIWFISGICRPFHHANFLYGVSRGHNIPNSY